MKSFRFDGLLVNKLSGSNQVLNNRNMPDPKPDLVSHLVQTEKLRRPLFSESDQQTHQLKLTAPNPSSKKSVRKELMSVLKGAIKEQNWATFQKPEKGIM